MQICVRFGSISYHLITIKHVAKNESATIKNDNKIYLKNCAINYTKCEKKSCKMLLYLEKCVI